MEGLGTLATMPILDLLEMPGDERPVPKIAEIQAVVAGAYGVTVAELKCRDRKRCYAVPRQIAAALCREMTKASLPQIGVAFGNRDHTTILFAYRKIKELETADHELAKDLSRLRREVDAVVSRRPLVERPIATISPPAPRRKRAIQRPVRPVEIAA